MLEMFRVPRNCLRADLPFTATVRKKTASDISGAVLCIDLLFVRLI